jgi:uncharacterized membrane protein
LKAEELGGRSIDEKEVVRIKRSTSYSDLWSFLFAGMILACLTVISAQFPPTAHTLGSWLVLIGRIILGVPFVLYIPGYLLQGLFFPLKMDLEKEERFGLSLGLSVALVTLLALLLNALPWGLSTSAILVGQGSLIIVLMLVTALVRHLLSPEQAYTPDVWPKIDQWWSGISLSEKRMMVIMAGSLLIAGVIAAWIFLAPASANYFTEFYMLGPEGLAENFPREVSIGQTITVTIGITNRERSHMEYYVEVWQVDPFDEAHRQLVGKTQSFTLKVGENHQWDQAWQPAWAGQDQQFEFLLFTTGRSEQYRRLLLWTNISK